VPDTCQIKVAAPTGGLTHQAGALTGRRPPAHEHPTILTCPPYHVVRPGHRVARAEYLTGRWQLSRYSPGSETWQRVGSYPSRKAAISAAYGEENQR
jgi:hypothetical protein